MSDRVAAEDGRSILAAISRNCGLPNCKISRIGIVVLLSDGACAFGNRRLPPILNKGRASFFRVEPRLSLAASKSAPQTRTSARPQCRTQRLTLKLWRTPKNRVDDP